MSRPEWSIDKEAHIPQYNALVDSNMRHYFESKAVQKHLMETAQIDSTGRILHLDRQRSKLNIIEREFERVDKEMHFKERDEADIRHRVQVRRMAMLEEFRRKERLERIKQDRSMCKEIVSAILAKDSSGI